MAKRKDIETGTGKRATQGTSAYRLVDAPSASEFGKGMVVKKAGGGIGKPEAATAGKRAQVGQDRLGPRFAIATNMPGPQAPEASLTQRNTIYMRSAVNRSAPNFNLGRLG